MDKIHAVTLKVTHGNHEAAQHMVTKYSQQRNDDDGHIPAQVFWHRCKQEILDIGKIPISSAKNQSEEDADWTVVPSSQSSSDITATTGKRTSERQGLSPLGKKAKTACDILLASDSEPGSLATDGDDTYISDAQNKTFSEILMPSDSDLSSLVSDDRAYHSDTFIE
jgi:hypothetical protein